MRDRADLFACLRYKDATAAIDFLCRAFGFARHAVYGDEKDPSIVHHAELVLGRSMIMVSSAPDQANRNSTRPVINPAMME